MKDARVQNTTGRYERSMRSMAGKFGRRFARRFVLVLAGLAVLTLAGPAAGLSDAEYR